ncbi:hypothetical protein [Kutzneria kofuensis]|uniref:hypothetical protein n=1 Tax=Kutzneria kofuensis TaxID=103725 RepID=UPI0031EEC981
MPVDHQAEIDQLMADYRRSREQLVAVQRGMAAIRETVTSHDDLVTVTVGPEARSSTWSSTTAPTSGCGRPSWRS